MRKYAISDIRTEKSTPRFWWLLVMLPVLALAVGMMKALNGPAPLQVTAATETVVTITKPQPNPYEVITLDPQRQTAPPPLWQQNAVAFDTDARPRIIIVLDDLGLNRSATRRTVALDGPLTLAFLPYAEGVAEQAQQARAVGHELLLHMPMEPLNADRDPGPGALRTSLSLAQVQQTLTRSLDRFDGYVGINNHMGSKFTSNAALMRPVLDELSQRGLLFLDSFTTGRSQAGAVAQQVGLPFARRDVFLDHDSSPDFIRRQLAEVEAVARRTGQAIAIGHPYDTTLTLLEDWLPTLEEKGFALAPLTTAYRNQPVKMAGL